MINFISGIWVGTVLGFLLCAVLSMGKEHKETRIVINSIPFDKAAWDKVVKEKIIPVLQKQARTARFRS